MPTTFNGFGTTYAKHREARFRPGTCSHCGEQRRLESFNTHVAIALLFAPTVKLGAKRIIDLCPLCSTHRALDADVWRSTLDAAVARATALLRDDAAGADVTVDELVAALGAVFDIGDGAACAAVRGLLAARLRTGRFEDDRRLLMVAGRAALDDNDPNEAIAFYTRARAKDPDNDDVAYALAFVHILQLTPQHALPLLETVWRHSRAAGLPLCLLLVDAFQTLGDHEAALRLLARLSAAFPAEMKNAKMDLVRGLSEKARKSGRPVFRPQLRGVVFPAALKQTPAASMSSLDRTVLAFLLVGVVVAYGGLVAWVRDQALVSFVNGTGHDYDVEVDGQAVHLPSGARVPLRVGQGLHQVVVRGPTGTTTESFDNTEFVALAPLGLLRTQIVNPDKAAVLLRDTIDYSKPSGEGYSASVDTGSFFYDLKVDYAFELFPHSIDDKDRSPVKTRVSLPGLRDSPRVVFEKRGAAAADSLLRRRLAFDPEDGAAASQILDLTGAVVDTATLELLTSLAAQRPTRVEAALALLRLVRDKPASLAAVTRVLQKDADACASFALFAAKDPPDDAVHLQSALVPPACEYAQNAAAFEAAVAGDLDTAARLVADVHPRADRPSLFWAWQQTQLALGNVAALSKHPTGDPAFDAAKNAMIVAFQRRDAAEAARVMRVYRQGHPDDEEGGSALEIVAAYGRRDRKGLAEAVARAKELDIAWTGVRTDDAFELALIDGRIDDAIRVSAGDSPLWAKTLVAASALRHHPARSDLVAEAAAVLTDRRGAQWLTKKPTVAELRALRVEPGLAVAIATLVAERWPDAPELRAEAERLAWDESVPTLFLAARPPTP